MQIDLNQRPTIIIGLTKEIDREALNPLLYGMEEEGIPYTIENQLGKEVKRVAFEAANSSSLLVGIGFDGDQVVIQYRNLPIEKPFLELQGYRGTPKQEIRTLGSNAARLVKGIALKIK